MINLQSQQLAQAMVSHSAPFLDSQVRVWGLGDGGPMMAKTWFTHPLRPPPPPLSSAPRQHQDCCHYVHDTPRAGLRSLTHQRVYIPYSQMGRTAAASTGSRSCAACTWQSSWDGTGLVLLIIGWQVRHMPPSHIIYNMCICIPYVVAYPVPAQQLTSLDSSIPHWSFTGHSQGVQLIVIFSPAASSLSILSTMAPRSPPARITVSFTGFGSNMLGLL